MHLVMEQQQQHERRGRRAWLGILLILAGIILVANQFNLISGNLSNIIFSWQSLLIFLGLIFLGRKGNNATGSIMIFIGAFFLIPEIFNVPYEWRRLFWPVVLIIIGITFLFSSALRHPHRIQAEGSDSDYLDDINVFSGHDRIITSDSFRGGSVVSVFGGGKYDLRNAKLSDGTNVLEMTHVFGGSKLIVPSDWDVKVEVVAIFGGYTDKRIISTLSPERKLIIKGAAIFGGGEITSI